MTELAITVGVLDDEAPEVDLPTHLYYWLGGLFAAIPFIAIWVSQA